MNSITVIGRRWFKKGPGTTYHTADIIVDGKLVHKLPYSYGYDNQYVHNAAEWLEKAGYIELNHHENGSVEALWVFCERANITLHYQCSDVERKKDL